MPWYMWICVSMMIIPFFLLAILPETIMSNWIYTFFILSMVLGFLGVKYLPDNTKYLPNDKNKEP